MIFVGYVCSHSIARGATGDTLQESRENGGPMGLQRTPKNLQRLSCMHADVWSCLPGPSHREHSVHLHEKKFQVGLEYKNSARLRPLDKVIGYSLTCDGCSHLASVADIVLGAFRYCVNEPNNEAAGGKMYPLVSSLMWKRYGRLVGLKLNPAIGSTRYAHQYDALLTRLKKYLASPQADENNPP